VAKAVSIHTIPPETLADALGFIAEHVREADREEVYAASGVTVFEAITEGCALSTRAWLILDRTGLPVGVFGVAPTLTPGVGLPWLIAAEGAEVEWVAVAKQTRRYLKELHEDFPVLYNWVDARNELAVGWLLWAGFSLVDGDPQYGFEGRTFIQFARVADNV
jgi:hypothetical protein